jgi:hypothetical protein
MGERKGLAVTSLVVGILSFLTLGCLGIGAVAGLALGIVALVKASKSPQEYGGKGLAWGGIITSGLGLLMLVPAVIIAAIAIPSLLRARISANESSTIGDIRSVISAQAAYQMSNGGYYEGRLDCLAKPSECLPEYPSTSPTFIDPAIASLQPKSGYRRSLHTASPGAVPSSSSRSSVEAYAYIAVPITPGQTGIRGFCGDASGILCSTADGSEPGVRNGACDLDTCQALQ